MRIEKVLGLIVVATIQTGCGTNKELQENLQPAASTESTERVAVQSATEHYTVHEVCETGTLPTTGQPFQSCHNEYEFHYNVMGYQAGDRVISTNLVVTWSIPGSTQNRTSVVDTGMLIVIRGAGVSHIESWDQGQRSNLSPREYCEDDSDCIDGLNGLASNATLIATIGSSDELATAVVDPVRNGLGENKVSDSQAQSQVLFEELKVSVQNLYSEILGRQGSDAEITWQAQNIRNGIISLSAMRASFLRSPEYKLFLQRKVSDFYTVLLGRGGSFSEINAWAEGVFQNQMTLAQVKQGFLTSTEYRIKLITNWYRTYLFREPEAGVVAWRIQILAGGYPVDQMERDIACSPEAKALGGKFCR